MMVRQSIVLVNLFLWAVGALCGQIPQPHPYITSGNFSGLVVPESPDPLVAYRWPNPKASDGMEIFLVKPKVVTTATPESFMNLSSLLTENADVLVNGTGSIQIDFGLEMGAWIEFDSPDCPGGIEMSISEYNEPGVNKTAIPVKYGDSYRLELNDELYDGVRFAWIHVNTFDTPWHITSLRAVNQVKPTNYNGSFSCNNTLLTQIWYMSAYGVKASFCEDYFGAILMERGDRMSWTGDAHPAQAASLVAFANYDFLKRNIENTSEQSNGIRSYSLYWVLSLLDYYNYTGDTSTLNRYLENAIAKLDDAYNVFGTDPHLRFYGWDERLCAGFEIWFRPSPEAQNAYKMLSIRVWKDFADAMGALGRSDLQEKYDRFAFEKINELRRDKDWYTTLGLHSAADAVNTGFLSEAEMQSLYTTLFQDRVNRLSLSPFNQYFIIQALSEMNRRDDALTSVLDMWGGMVKYGGTTPFEVFRPSWNEVIGKNDAVPNAQCGIVSLCHPWGAGPVKWLNEEVLGIKPTTPGFSTYHVVPHLGHHLTQVSGKTPTPFGDIIARFNMDSGECFVSAPVGTLGKIGIPKAGQRITRILINGTLAWDGTYHAVSGIGGLDQDENFVYLTEVKSGDYKILVSLQGARQVLEEQPIVYGGLFLRHDSTTSGNWGGVYGKDGYVLCNYQGNGQDNKKLPPYVKSIEYYRAFPKSGLPDDMLWESETEDCRALSPDVANGNSRNAACFSNSDQTMSLTIEMDGNREYQIALYFVDWDNQGLRQAVEMMDGETMNLIAPVQIVRNFSGGTYLLFSYHKSVKFRINKIRGTTVTLSGIFFDPVTR